MSAGRSVQASTAERSLLLSVMASHLGVLDTRDPNKKMDYYKVNSLKQSLWEQVMRQFNTRSLVQRSRHQIQTLYKNMKAKARKYQSRIVEAQKEGLPMPEQDHVSEMLLKMLAKEKKQQKLCFLEQDMLLNSVEDMSPNCENTEEKYNFDGSYKFDQSTANQFDEGPLSILFNTENMEFKVNPENTDDYSHVDDKDTQVEQYKRKMSQYSDEDFDENQDCDLNVDEFSANEKSSLLRVPKFPNNKAKRFKFDTLDETSSSDYCCSSFHDVKMEMIKKEHELKMDILKEERAAKLVEHNTKMKILEFEQQLVAEKIEKDKHPPSPPNEDGETSWIEFLIKNPLLLTLLKTNALSVNRSNDVQIPEYNS